mmetsp:Transcript_21006/g.60729  ORF Transcript_21006/g.60729 Transcript_21006/m.60729 type:complete len:206 (+) Transcript_21006:632-1249(+)
MLSTPKTSSLCWRTAFCKSWLESLSSFSAACAFAAAACATFCVACHRATSLRNTSSFCQNQSEGFMCSTGIFRFRSRIQSRRRCFASSCADHTNRISSKPSSSVGKLNFAMAVVRRECATSGRPPTLRNHARRSAASSSALGGGSSVVSPTPPSSGSWATSWLSGADAVFGVALTAPFAFFAGWSFAASSFRLRSASARLRASSA